MTKSKTNTVKTETVAAVAATKANEVPTVSPNGETVVTPESKLQLKQCEDTIRQNEGSLFSVGRNLGKISSEGLYKAAGFTEFAVYTKERWGMSDKYAYRLIKAAKCLDTLTSHETTGTWVLPRNESQIRPIAQLKEEQWVVTWEKVMAKFGNQPFTAEDVKLVINPDLANTDEADGDDEAAEPKTEEVSAKKLQKKLIKIDEIVNKALAEEIAAKDYRKILERIKKLIEKSTEKAEQPVATTPAEPVAAVETAQPTVPAAPAPAPVATPAPAAAPVAPAAPAAPVKTKKTKAAKAA